MVTVRKRDAGFTLTELMMVVVILSLLAAISTPLFTRDNNARKGRDWSKMVAQLLQRARFQALGDRANIHVLFYRTRVDMYREEPPGAATPFTLLLHPGARGRGRQDGGDLGCENGRHPALRAKQRAGRRARRADLSYARQRPRLYLSRQHGEYGQLARVPTQRAAVVGPPRCLLRHQYLGPDGFHFVQ